MFFNILFDLFFVLLVGIIVVKVIWIVMCLFIDFLLKVFGKMKYVVRLLLIVEFFFVIFLYLIERFREFNVN